MSRLLVFKIYSSKPVMDFGGVVCPTGFSQPVTFIRGCTLCTAVQDTILYSDGHGVFKTFCPDSHSQEKASGTNVEHLQLIFITEDEAIADNNPIIILHTFQDAPRKNIALATLNGDVYLAELIDSTLHIARLHRTKCYGTKVLLSGTVENRKFLAVLCMDPPRLFLFDLQDATLLFESCIDVDAPVSGAFSGNTIYIVCKQSLISYDLIYQHDNTISVTFKSFTRLPLNGARVLCSRLTRSGILLLGLNTRHVCAIDKHGASVSTWCKVSKYEPLYVLDFKDDSKEGKGIERITIAAVSNEVTTQQRNSKERASEFRTDGMIIGMAEAAAHLVFLTEETVYFYPKVKQSNQ